MLELIAKGVLSGAIIVAASELAQRSTVLAAIIVSLPLTSILALTWIYLDGRDVETVSTMSWSILLVVAPSVVFFAALPLLLGQGLPFIVALPGAAIVMILAYGIYAWAAARFFGLQL